MDKVVIYQLDPAKVDLAPHGFGQNPPGGGPRHMKFHTSGKFIYVLNELALSVTVFAYDAEKGTMTPIQTIPTVSEEQKAKEAFVSASEIRVHPSGKFVYAANRGHDTITAFRVDQATGKLILIEIEPIRGGWPRNFNLDPTGKWLLAAGRDSNTIAVFAIDPDSGELTYTRTMVMVPHTNLRPLRIMTTAQPRSKPRIPAALRQAESAPQSVLPLPQLGPSLRYGLWGNAGQCRLAASGNRKRQPPYVNPPPS